MEGEFEQCESFGIDSGELDGLTPQDCFVLGYELATIHAMAETIAANETIAMHLVHAANKSRIEAALQKRRRGYQWTWPSDDVSEAWVYLTILANA